MPAAEKSEPVGESGRTAPRLVDTGMSFTKEQRKKLKAFVKRGVDIEEKAKSLKGLKSALMDEVEEAEFDRNIVKRVIRERATPKEDRAYEQATFDFYMAALEEDDAN